MLFFHLRIALLVLALAALRRFGARWLPSRLFAAGWLLLAARLLLPVWVGLPLLPAGGEGGGVPGWLGPLRWGGAAVGALMFLPAWARGRRICRTARPADDPRVLAWADAHRLRRRVLASPAVQGPAVYGVLRPVIVLPDDTRALSPAALDDLLLHEWLHLCHHNTLKKAVALAAVLLNWFNPACWLLPPLLARDLERCCDARLLARRGSSHRAAYARLLLAQAAARTTPPGTAFCGGRTKERITAIMFYQKLSPRRALCAALLAALLFTAAFAVPAAAAPETAPSVLGLTLGEAETVLESRGFRFVLRSGG